jgi:transcriptional antiterminator RfaH
VRTAGRLFDATNFMPILAPQADIYPATLLDPVEQAAVTSARPWWVYYLLSRREKDFMRRLRAMSIAHYAPLILQRSRSPNGRMRTSQVPLFPGYVFVQGNEEDRYRALTTNCVSRSLLVNDASELVADLRQIQRLIASGAPLTLESRLEVGQPVRVRRGPFAEFEGVIVKRQGATRLVVAVRFLQQGASILLEDCEVEAL